MYYAMNENNFRVHINDSLEGKNYYCSVCGEKLIRKMGSIREHHFSHKSVSSCDHWYCNKGEWHREMQSLFYKDYQEVPLTVDKEKHIADICIPRKEYSTVIEFQHSYLAEDEFFDRSRFWLKNNNEIIWVYDCSEISVYSKDEKDYKVSKKDMGKINRKYRSYEAPIILCCTSATRYKGLTYHTIRKPVFILTSSELFDDKGRISENHIIGDKYKLREFLLTQQYNDMWDFFVKEENNC